VDARVGAAGAREADAVTRERTQRLEEHALHGRLVALDLPSAVRGAVVREVEPEDAIYSRSSAIWTALVAAPLRSWSPTTQKLSERGCERSSRIRPT
jgi:hypothetical protein